VSGTIWQLHGRAVGGVVSVLFTRDRRVFFEVDDGTIRLAAEWERDEALAQMLCWRDAAGRWRSRGDVFRSADD
jgi:hypothetical protein